MTDSSPVERQVGRYVLHGEIASGGMASVHLGRLVGQAGFSRTVAIKRLHPHYARDREFVAMFIDEARLAGRIQHPNVVNTLDVEQVGDELFLIMEYVHGESLACLFRVLQKRGESFPVRIAASLVAGALFGLHAAHEARAEDGTALGLVHRDVSPQNILVSVDGTARVLDFGVAKAAVRVQTTRDGQTKGKVSYMAPEQIRALPVDRRSDVYGAAVVLWELLTLRRLFDGDSEAAVLFKAISSEVSPPSHLVADIPPALDHVVMRGLARDPAFRFATAREMAIALEHAVPLASAREVGEWLARISGDTLAARAGRVKDVESRRSLVSMPAIEPSGPAVVAPQDDPPTVLMSRSSLVPGPGDTSQISTIAVTSAPQATLRPAPPRAILAIALLLATSAGAAALLFFAWSRSAQAPADSELPAAASAPSPPASSPPAASAPPPQPTASAAPPPEIAASAAPAEPLPSTRPAANATEPTLAASAEPRASAAVARPIAAPRSTARPMAAAPAKAGCNPPYTVNERGIRRIKPECM